MESEIITCESEVQNFNSMVAPDKKNTETLLDKPTFIQNNNSIGSIYARKNRVETSTYDPSHLH